MRWLIWDSVWESTSMGTEGGGVGFEGRMGVFGVGMLVTVVDFAS